MSEDIEEQDTYHYDFTTASEWEIFIARLEEVIHEWKLPHVKYGSILTKGQFRSGEWGKKSEKLLFADSEFTMTRYCLKTTASQDVVSPLDEDVCEERIQALEDMMSSEIDFLPPTNADCANIGTAPSMLVRWYGLRDFVVLTAARGQAISTESKVKILLSSVLIAINNSYCQIPVFVQVHEPNQMYYLGVCEGKVIRTDFEMVHLRRTPPHCKYLTGLLNLFKSKVASPTPLEPVTIAVRFTYLLHDWTRFKWAQEPPDFDFLQDGTEGLAELGKLPFGSTFDPISELQLYTTWPRLVENAVVDSESYSDFEPSQAPRWSVCIKMAARPACLLGEYLSEFLQLCSSGRSMRDLLGDLADKAGGGANLSSSLNLLTESRVPTISKVIRRAKGGSRAEAKTRDGPISEDLLMPILYFLFPDAENNSQCPYPEIFGKEDESAKVNKVSNEDLSGLKSCPPDSLVWRLTVVMSHLIHSLGGSKAAAHLWYEFVQEMRFRWEKSIAIPGVMPGFPDPRTCLLHQKLQMLNCCVARKCARDQEQVARAASVELVDSDTDSDDDEFFDCSDDERDEVPSASTRRKNKHSLWNQPVGRLRRHGNLRLVTTGDHLYIPLTQESTPKTEDQVEEDAEVLLQLGTDAHGAELRARMMSASLLSDMESFKAANPGAILDDFIRWYSPRDWVESDELDQYGQRKGTLSARMQIKGNTWMDVWDAAKPVPARRQKRLFDDTREAEKVLYFLDSRRPAQMAQLLVPVLTHAAVCKLTEQHRDELPGLDARLRCVVKNAERLTRHPQPHLNKYEDLATDIVSIEATVSQFKSLNHKFADPKGTMESADLLAFLIELMSSPEVEAPGGPRDHIRSKILAMFGEAQKIAQMITEAQPLGPNEESWTLSSSNFPQPLSREFLMRVMAARPAPNSIPTPQRLYATLKKEEFRLAGSFSQATNFQ